MMHLRARTVSTFFILILTSSFWMGCTSAPKTVSAEDSGKSFNATEASGLGSSADCLGEAQSSFTFSDPSQKGRKFILNGSTFMSVAAEGEEPSNGNRWIAALNDSQSTLIAKVSDDFCPQEPTASYIRCSAEPLKCEFTPSTYSDEPDSKRSLACLDELHFFSEEKVAPILRACEYFQSSNYEENRRLILQKNAQCGEKMEFSLGKSLPNLKQFEESCAAIETFFARVPRGN